MRDAFGGTFMFKLIIIFIVFFVTFATIAVSYSKVFRLKNAVIDIIEQEQLGYGAKRNNWNTDAVDQFLDNSAYDYHDNQSVVNACKSQSAGDEVGRLSGNGACILKLTDGNLTYYRVTLYMVIKMPGFSSSFVIPISGETKDYSTRYSLN